MRVVTNMQAVNAHRVLTNTRTSMAAATEKLSSGFRINRAGDDAAGLAISEKMRGQVRGLQQASRNAQDGISLIQTAEGATQEIHAMLQRARELAVQTASDTMTDDDRSKVQLEVDALVGQIDTIASNTEFNTIKLLDSSSNTMSDFSGIPQATVDYLTANMPGWINDSLTVLRDNFGIALPDSPTQRKMTVRYYSSGADTAGASMGTADGGATLIFSVNLANLTDTNGALIADDQMDRLIAHEMMHALEFTEMPFALAPPSNDIETFFMEGLSMLVQGGSTGFGPIDGTISFDGTWDGGAEYATAFAAMKVLHEITVGGIGAFINRLELGDTLDQAFANTVQGNSIEGGLSAIVSAEIANASDFITFFNGVAVDGYLNNSTDLGVTGAITNAAVQGSYVAVTSDNTIPNSTGTALTNTHYDLTFDNAAVESYQDIVFQLGANENQKIRFNAVDMSALRLGVASLSVSTRDSATQTITQVDTAIGIVSTTRAYFGSLQNRLEHTIKNLDTSAENLQASESRIRDVDMAKEMMHFTTINILSQAGQAMLAQANQSNQGVLQLLR